jgi:hypothetical protein
MRNFLVLTVPAATVVGRRMSPAQPMPEKCVNVFATRATANRNAGPKTAKCTATAIVAGSAIAIVEIASKLGQPRFATHCKSWFEPETQVAAVRNLSSAQAFPLGLSSF